MRDGNACLGLCIGAALAIPVYGGIAWIVSKVLHLDYGMALVGTIAVGSVAGGVIVLVGLRRTPKNDEALESHILAERDSRASR